MPALYLYLSGRNNLVAVGDALGGVPKKRVDEVLELVGLQNRQKDRVRTYSLGMKQRLGVAMALLQDPDRAGAGRAGQWPRPRRYRRDA